MARERFIEARGLRVRCLEEGSGMPVVLLHGASLGSSADVWAGNLADFSARGFRAIALDLPGFGQSDNPVDPSAAFRSRFVLHFLDALKLDRAHVIGHSQSGRIAVELALENSERLRKIVVVGTTSLLPPPAGPARPDGDGEEGGATLPTLEDTRKLLEDAVYDKEALAPAAIELRHRMSIGKNFDAFTARREAKAAQEKTGERSRQSMPLWQRLGEVRVPMRFIFGKQDRDAAARVVLARQLNPDLDLHLIEHCRHLVQWDAPREFAALATKFLAAT
jgi:pimeloyl-ACP methyl ester carboxylesterase